MPPTAEQLTLKLNWARKQKAYAWAKFYETTRGVLHDDHAHYATFNQVADDRSIPEHIKTTMKETATALKKKWECPICVDMIDDDDLEITNCGHFYCKGCLAQWQAASKARGDAKWKCCSCNRKHAYKGEDDE
jgi:hypothetical protein